VICTIHELAYAHQHRHTVGDRHGYQGRFKSFPVETEGTTIWKPDLGGADGDAVERGCDSMRTRMAKDGADEFLFLTSVSSPPPK